MYGLTVDVLDTSDVLCIDPPLKLYLVDLSIYRDAGAGEGHRVLTNTLL